MKVLSIFASLVVVVISAGYHDEVDEIPEMESRVAGGTVAPEGAHPYLVGLIVRVKKREVPLICASSLVNADSLVTAAHCVDNAKSARAVLGTLMLFKGGLRVKTKVFFIHPLHNPDEYIGDYDIAVVKLPEAVNFTSTIQPISLPEDADDAERVSEWATVAGWGVKNDQQQFVGRKTRVRQAQLQIIPETVCKNRLLERSKVYGNNVCAQGDVGVGVCRGDSGAPLVVERSGRKVLIGVASFANNFCELGYPSGFTRVATYLDFIQSHL